MEEIEQADPTAVVVNGYYSGYLGEDMSLDELTARYAATTKTDIAISGDYSKSTTTGCRQRSLSRKQATTHAAALNYLKKPTGTAKNPTPIYLTGA